MSLENILSLFQVGTILLPLKTFSFFYSILYCQAVYIIFLQAIYIVISKDFIICCEECRHVIKKTNNATF